MTFKSICGLWGLVLIVAAIGLAGASKSQRDETPGDRTPPLSVAGSLEGMDQIAQKKLSDNEIAGIDAGGAAATILYAEHCTTPPISPKALNIAQQVRARRPIETEAKINKYRATAAMGDVWCRFMAPRVEHLNVSVN